ncbi:MAG: ABC transporter permease [Acidobacteriota bacterium]
MDTFFQDLKYALRALRSNPGFAIVAVITLALGIGLSTAVFSLVDVALLRPLPFDDADELVWMTEWSKNIDTMSFSYPNLIDYQEKNEVYTHLAGHRGQDFNLTGEGAAEQIGAVQATASLFPMMRVTPELGRVFTAQEDVPNGPKVAVLSHSFWQRRFGGDPDVLGKRLLLDGEPWEVIGVMPRGFFYPVYFDQIDMYQPLGHFAEDWLETRGNHPGIFVTARRKPGISVEAAEVGMKQLAAQLAEAYPDTNTGNSVTVTDLQARMVRRMKPALLVLWGAVTMVLLIACVNVANLLLARSERRGQEVAVRAALGAGKGRLVRQLLTESLVLAGLGAVNGLAVAWVSLRLLRAQFDTFLPSWVQVGLDPRVLSFSLAAAVLTGVIFGLAPAIRLARGALSPLLRDGRRTTRGSSLRSWLVIGETALALVLLVAATLFFRSLTQRIDADPGFNYDNVLLTNVNLPDETYAEPEARVAVFDELIERVAALPGVESVGTALPMLSGWQSSVAIEGQPWPDAGEARLSEVLRVTAGMADVLELNILQGRFITDDDRADTRNVAVVDEQFASFAWPDQSAIGQRFRFGRPDEEDTEEEIEEAWIEVVGVVSHIEPDGVGEISRMQAWLPSSQQPLPFATLAVRTSGDPMLLADPIGAVVREIDRDLPLSATRTMTEDYRSFVAPQKMATNLLAVFAVLAVALAALGIYGVMAYTVASQRREIGVRLALGASRGNVLSRVVTDGLRLTGTGLGLGLLAAFAGAPLIADQLFRVEPRDPVLLATLSLLLASVAALACAIPAWRASRVDPIHVLRYE